MHSLFIHRGNKEQVILTGNSEDIISLNKALSNWYIENRYENYFQVLYMLVNLFFTFCDFRVMISNSNNIPAYIWKQQRSKGACLAGITQETETDCR